MRRQHTSTPIDYSALPTHVLTELVHHAWNVIHEDKIVYGGSHQYHEIYDIQRDEKSLSFWNKKLDDIRAVLHARSVDHKELRQWTKIDINPPSTVWDLSFSPLLSSECSPDACARPTVRLSTDQTAKSFVSELTPRPAKAGKSWDDCMNTWINMNPDIGEKP